MAWLSLPSPHVSHPLLLLRGLSLSSCEASRPPAKASRDLAWSARRGPQMGHGQESVALGTSCMVSPGQIVK